MDNSKLKKCFGLAATNVTNLYQTSIKFQEEAYKKGKIDAFNEIISFCVENSKGNIKNVNQKTLVEYLQQKLAEVDSKNEETMIQDPKPATSQNISNLGSNSVGISTNFSNTTVPTNTMLIEGSESGSFSSNRFGNMNFESQMYNNQSGGVGGGERTQQFELSPGFLQNIPLQSNQNAGYGATNASKSQWEKWK